MNIYLYVCIACALVLLWLLSRWHEKKIIREASKILAPIKQDALMEVPKSKLQAHRISSRQINHDKMQENLNHLNSLHTKFDNNFVTVTANKPMVSKQKIEPFKFANPVNDLVKDGVQHKDQVVTPMQGFNTAKKSNNNNQLMNAHRILDDTYDEILEDMAKRAALRKNN